MTASSPGLDLAELRGVAIGSNHGCVVVGDAGARSAFCWGGNAWAQLGSGSIDGSGTPVRVLDFP